MAAPFPIDDAAGAWVPHGRFMMQGAAQGPLAGLTFAAKDVFDVAGHPTGAGNPAWLATHPAPARSSSLVQRLLDAGAALAGKVITDELAYSIHGDNAHYGMPVNAAAPARIPGGSSSGSAAAVSARLVDFALGTDTGGSTRIPASYCGIWGLRTTHGLLPRDGMVPLHASFDTATWLAHDAPVFARVGHVLLPSSGFRPRRVVLLDEARAQAEPRVQAILDHVFARIQQVMPATHARICDGDTLEDWRAVYATIGAREAWQAHGDWIDAHAPDFAPAIAARWRLASTVTAQDAAHAAARRREIVARIGRVMAQGDILLLPSAATVPPLRDADAAEIERLRQRTMRICCIAGLGGLPQVSMPFQTDDGLAIGISLIGPAGSDRDVIDFAVDLAARLPPAKS